MHQYVYIQSPVCGSIVTISNGCLQDGSIFVVYFIVTIVKFEICLQALVKLIYVLHTLYFYLPVLLGICLCVCVCVCFFCNVLYMHSSQMCVLCYGGSSSVLLQVSSNFLRVKIISFSFGSYCNTHKTILTLPIKGNQMQ